MTQTRAQIDRLPPEPQRADFVERLYTLHQMAAMLGKSTDAVRRMVYLGQLPAVRVGARSVRIKASEWQQWREQLPGASLETALRWTREALPAPAAAAAEGKMLQGPEAAAYVGCHPQILYGLAGLEMIPYRWIGRKVYCWQAELDAWVTFWREQATVALLREMVRDVKQKGCVFTGRPYLESLLREEERAKLPRQWSRAVLWTDAVDP